MIGLLGGGEKYVNIFNRFDTIRECDGRTDRQTQYRALYRFSRYSNMPIHIAAFGKIHLSFGT